MKTVALLLVAVIGVATAAHDFDLFMKFMTDYNKVYSKEEMPVRFANFQATLERIHDMNQKDSATYGITEFADMSVEEFQMSLGMTEVHLRESPAGLSSLPKPDLRNQALPDAFDWNDKGMVAPVKNQASCGSCWAFSATGSMESVNAVKSGNGLQQLAEQELVDCDPQSGGCNGGWPDWAYHYIESNDGSGWEAEDSYPYTARNGECKYAKDKAVVTEAAHTTLCLATSQRPSEKTDACTTDAMKQAMMDNGALSVCLDAGPLMSYHGGVIKNASCRDDWQSHCVLATGWGVDGNGDAFWNVKNSWGASWGEEGYFRIAAGDNTCGIEATVFFPSV